MAASEVVIVSGAEYAKYDNVGGDTWVLRPFSPSIWIDKARNWAALECRTAGTTVTVFDIARGTQKKTANGKVWTPVQTLAPPSADEWWRIVDNKPGSRRYARPVSPFTTKDRADTHVAYLPGSAIPPRATLDDSYRPVGGPRLGMQDVYNYICRIGITRPGTLRGLHLFAHAYKDGPILLNTWPPAPDAPDRGLLDIDARADQDFTAANLPRVLVPQKFSSDADRESLIAVNPRSRSGFNCAWTDSATAVVWGCLHDDFVKGFVQQAATQLTAEAKRLGSTMAELVSLGDADPDLTFRPDPSGSLGGENRQFWADFFDPTTATTAVKKPLSWVVNQLVAINEQTYPGQLRSALQAGTTFPHRRVLAAPLGASTWMRESEQDTGVKALLRVVPGEFDVLLGFYQSLGYVYARDLADATKFGRGYGQFPPSAVD